jgi:ubiquitin C-terminal hydrolase
MNETRCSKKRESDQIENMNKLSTVSVARNPKGLKNSSEMNICFMNSLMQSFSYLEPLTSFLDSLIVRNAGWNCILRLVQNLMNDLRDASLRKNVLSIEGIMNNMWKKFPKQLSKGRHEDIFEALDCLLDAMDNDLKNFDVVYKENNEQISDNFDCVFGGELRCIQSCPDSNCSYVSNKVERFLTVALPLGNVNNQVSQSQRINSIEDGFKKFCSEEVLGEEQNYNCYGCKSQGVKGKKQLEFEKAPKVLAVCLKRFEFTNSGSIKIEDPVSFGFRFELFTSRGVENYDLICVLEHIGRTIKGGHYICHCKLDENNWITHDVYPPTTNTLFF